MLRSALLSTVLIAGVCFATPQHPITRSTEGGSPVVQLNYGAFRGNVSENVVQFLGMPFAAPPLGNLRFAPPAAPVPFSGIRNATAYGAACFQQQLSAPPALPFSLANNPIGGVSEDCLFINVIAPASLPSGKKLPVIMWIYGGGFEVGDTSANPGNSVVARSIALGEPVIYVSANYRLNAFGFLGGKEVKTAGVGNVGLRDQRFAMEWVQKYISSFGGDPKKVTIWGESAGAWSVGLHHVLNDGVQGQLFRGAIMESGAPRTLRPITSNQPLFDQIVQDTGCGNAANRLQCLRGVPYATLTAAINRTPDLFSFKSLEIVWQPTVDGLVIKRDPMISIQRGLFSKVPIISGNCEDEGTLFSFANMNITTDGQFLDYLRTTYGIPQNRLSAVAQTYPSDVTQGSPFGTGTANALTPQFKRLAAFQGDWIFQAQRRFFLKAMSRTQKTYSFLYKRGKSLIPSLGAFHSLDLAEFYGTGTSDFVAVDALINFVNTLDPNKPATANAPVTVSGTKWLPWGSSATQPPMLTFIDSSPGVTITTDTYRKNEMNLLNEVALGLAHAN